MIQSFVTCIYRYNVSGDDPVNYGFPGQCHVWYCRGGLQCHWGHLVGTLLHMCFDDRPTTTPEGSSSTSGVPGVPRSALTSFTEPVTAAVVLGSRWCLPFWSRANNWPVRQHWRGLLKASRRACPRIPMTLSSLDGFICLYHPYARN